MTIWLHPPVATIRNRNQFEAYDGVRRQPGGTTWKDTARECIQQSQSQPHIPHIRNYGQAEQCIAHQQQISRPPRSRHPTGEVLLVNLRRKIKEVTKFMIEIVKSVVLVLMGFISADRITWHFLEKKIVKIVDLN